MSELIGAYERHQRAAGMSAHTITARSRLLWALHDFLPFGLAYAGADELEDFLQSDPAWTAWTKRTYSNHMRAFYRWARGRWLETDPTIDMARPRTPSGLPNPVTEDELEHALSHSPDPWLTLITLAAYGGLRAAEAAGVRREDVTEQAIRIRRAKGGDEASIDTHPQIWRIVRSRPPGPLALTPGYGKPVTAKWIGTNERAFFDSIGLDEVVFHRFRHRFGSALLDAGNDLRTIQEAMRHRSITSTQGYTLVRGGQRRLAIRSLPSPTQPPTPNR